MDLRAPLRMGKGIFTGSVDGWQRYYGNCVAADDNDEWEKSCTDRTDGLHNSITFL